MSSASDTVRRALDQFKDTLSKDDAQTFSTTTYKDLWEGARQIEEEQGRRMDLRFMRRIEPFLASMQSYAPVIEVLCQGYPPMAFVWGPIKLILLLARHYSDVMEKILKAYAEIAEVLPRMDRLKRTFGDSPEFKQVLALIYSDIIEFHRRAYKMFRRKAWHIWFAFDWGLFERRFQSIISRLTSHCDLLDKEAASMHFIEMKAMRDKRLLEDEATELHRKNQMVQDVLIWLVAAEDAQEDYLHNILDRTLVGTCKFILDVPGISSWTDRDVGPGVLWLTGIPGAGKSFISSLIVQHLQSRCGQSTLYYLCGQKSSERDTCALILQTLANQLLRQNPDLAPLVHQAYLIKNSTKSSSAMKKLLKEVLTSLEFTHLVLDGVDECDAAVQHDVLSSLTEIQRHTEQHCRVLVSSRREPLIQKSLVRSSHISLEGRTTESLNLYVQAKVVELRGFFPDIEGSLWSDIENKLKQKAKGMFLWVRLVTAMLQEQMSQLDLENAVDRLPDGLGEAYGRIMSRIDSLKRTEKDRAYRVLFWVCTAYRPVTIHEVADAIVLKPRQAVLNKKTRSQNVDRDILEVCAPFLERSRHGVLDMVHFSAKEYLLDKQTGPFVDAAQAHFNAAFSCIVNMTSALGVVPRYNEGIPDTYFQTMLVQGSWGLQSYAHQYWADHTVSYLDSIPYLDDQAMELLGALEIFSKVSKRHDSGPHNRNQAIAGEKSLDISAALHKLVVYPRIRGLVHSWVHFRSRLNDMAPNFDDLQASDNWQLAEDDTFLSLIDNRLRNLRENVLRMHRSDLPPHIDQADFDAFIARFRFICRRHGCTQSFDQEIDRNDHEAGHTIPFPCLLCDFSGRGFRTRKQLQHHTRTYHMTSDDYEIPKSLNAASIHDLNSISNRDNMRPWANRKQCWNQQGRSIIQQTLYRVLSRVESDKTLTNPEPDSQAAIFKRSQTFDEQEPTMSFKSIQARVDAQQYETLGEFKDNVHQILSESGALPSSDSLETVDAICNEELGTVASGFSDFLSPEFTVVASSLPGRQPTISDVGVDINAAIAQGEQRAPYWSVAEKMDFQELVRKHGHDSNRISGLLMTKSPEDVTKYLSELVQSGREDLLQLANAADEVQQPSELDTSDTDTGASRFPEPMTNIPSQDNPAAAEHSLTPSSSDPKPFVVGLDDLLNYRPQRNPTNRTTAIPQLHAPQAKVVSSVQKRERKRRAKASCPYCNREFHDEYSVIKHVDRKHTSNRKVWVCEDVSPDKKFFGECKACSEKKRYSTKHNAFKHLRTAHFTVTTPKEALARWLMETEGPNPNSDNKHSDAVAAKHGDRLPGLWQSSKRQKIDNQLDSLHTSQTPSLIGHTVLPRMRDHPESNDPKDTENFFAGEDAGRESPGATPQGQKSQSGQPIVYDLPSGLSFDSLLPTPEHNAGYPVAPSPHDTGQQNPVRILFHSTDKALVRPDHVARLPHLSPFEQAACRDQVGILYHLLHTMDPSSQDHKDALQRLKHLSQVLIVGVRQWRRANTYAPSIPFTL